MRYEHCVMSKELLNKNGEIKKSIKKKLLKKSKEELIELIHDLIIIENLDKKIMRSVAEDLLAASK
jgi:hypothetical protein